MKASLSNKWPIFIALVYAKFQRFAFEIDLIFDVFESSHNVRYILPCYTTIMRLANFFSLMRLCTQARSLEMCFVARK